MDSLFYTAIDEYIEPVMTPVGVIGVQMMPIETFEYAAPVIRVSFDEAFGDKQVIMAAAIMKQQPGVIEVTNLTSHGMTVRFDSDRPLIECAHSITRWRPRWVTWLTTPRNAPNSPFNNPWTRSQREEADAERRPHLLRR